MAKTMIEQIARSMCRTAGVPENTKFQGKPMWVAYSSEARSILADMREPTGGMADAGAEVVPGDDPANHQEVAKDVWRAMIDEALAGI